jgi:hypothetical protein
MTWDRVRRYIGPGLHWGKSREALIEARQAALAANDPDAAGHIGIILGLRDEVMLDAPRQRPRLDSSC